MLELAVLGLLKERPMHGYQLSRELGDSLGGLWRVSYGSLYPTLRRLEGDVAIESEAGDVRGARRKKVYRITPKGEQVFLELLQESPQDTQTEDARFRMRLAFFRYLPPETRIRLLERRRQALQERLATIAESLRTGRHTDDYGRALIEHNRSVTESDITWLEQLIAAERTKNAPTGGLKRRRAALRGREGSSSEAIARGEAGSSSEAIARGEAGSSSEAIARGEAGSSSEAEARGAGSSSEAVARGAGSSSEAVARRKERIS